MSYDNPYISQEELSHLNKENDKVNWVSKKNFVTYGRLKNNGIKEFLGLNPLGNCENYVYRPENKEKWLSKRNFLKY